MIDTTALSPRNAAIVAALQEAATTSESGHLSVDTLRRKLKTTKANIDEALVELTGAFEDIEYDADSGVAMIDVSGAMGDELEREFERSAADLPDDGAADQFADQPYDEFPMGDDEEGDEPVSKFRFPERKKVEYEEKGGNCGDTLAEALTAYLNLTHDVPRKDGKGTKRVSGIDLQALEQTADANGITAVKGNNPGQMRMNLANMLRAKWRRGDDIVVGGTTIPGLANYKSRKTWIAEQAASIQRETKCTTATALLQAEQEFETRAAAAEYDPTLGVFVD